MDIPTDSVEGRLGASTFDNLIGEEVESYNKSFVVAVVFCYYFVLFLMFICSKNKFLVSEQASNLLISRRRQQLGKLELELWLKEIV